MKKLLFISKYPNLHMEEIFRYYNERYLVSFYFLDPFHRNENVIKNFSYNIYSRENGQKFDTIISHGFLEFKFFIEILKHNAENIIIYTEGLNYVRVSNSKLNFKNTFIQKKMYFLKRIKLNFLLLILMWVKKRIKIGVQGDLKRFESSLFLKSNKITIFQSLYMPLREGLNEKRYNEKITIAYFGRISKEKNIDFVEELFMKLDNSKFNFFIAGKGFHPILNHDWINNLGFLSKKELREIFLEVDILVLNSLYEGWGAIVNEALDKGVQVLVGTEVGSKVLVKDTLNGSIINGIEDAVKFINDYSLNVNENRKKSTRISHEYMNLELSKYIQTL